jgi:predicted dehydrogenase/RimJ/RimL family protein N-acetyltransferase
VAVIGQGSIGRRHASILLELGQQVVAYDPAPVTPPPDGVQLAGSAQAALDGVDAAVIASPSSDHVAHARMAIERSIPVLVEKPLATDAAGAAELDCLAQERGTLLAVAMNLRHHAGVVAISQLLGEETLGRVLSARAWSGSWLPGWRPGTDYRQGYSARADLGGGVLRDVAVHELDYLSWLLGRAVSVTALAKHASGLEVDVEDVAAIAVELESGALVETSVNYFDHSYHRGCRLVGERATAHWSWEDERLTITGADSGVQRRVVSADVAVSYRRQLEEFLSAVRGPGGQIVEASAARHVLAVIDAAHVSAREGRRVVLAPAIVLRPASRDDGDRLRAWRNDPDTRRHSRVSAEVTPDEHERWLSQMLSAPDIRLWIAEAAGEALGQIRVSWRPDGWAELHVNIAPEARGRGLGTAVIGEAAARALATGNTSGLVAHIKDENRASLRAFTRAGFTRVGRDSAGLARLERRPRS